MSDEPLIDRVLRDANASRQLLARITRMERPGRVAVTLHGQPVTINVTPVRKVNGRLIRCT